MDVRVVIRRGADDRSQYLYANVYDAVTDEILIAADLEYVIVAIKKHGYIITKLEAE